jgi:hypothetical protein
MNNISYRDIMVLPGEDIPFVMSILFSSIHGCQRSRGVNQMVAVPIFARDGETFVWGKDGKLPNGFRVFAESPDALDFDVSPRIDDAVKLKKVKTVSFDQDTPVLIVKRLRDIDSSYERRQEKRSQEDKVKERKMAYEKKLVESELHTTSSSELSLTESFDVKSRRTLFVKKDKFLLLEKSNKRIPVFYNFDIVSDKMEFGAINSYGFGVVPFVDLSQ